MKEKESNSKNNISISGEYSYKILSKEKFKPFFVENNDKVFKDNILFNLGEVLSDFEKENIKNLSKYSELMYILRIGIYYKNQQIGWMIGRQESSIKFYMTNTGIVKEHQNKGVYTKLLPQILKILKEKGFQIAYSKHSTSNNRVLVPKLKQGFLITGFEISDLFGTLIYLSYHFNKDRRDIIKFRTGEQKLSNELKKFVTL